MYIQVIGPNKEKNQLFIEKMQNLKYSALNNFSMTTEKQYDSKAYKSYFILTDDIKLTEEEKTSWMEYYYNNKNMQWVSKF